MAGQHEIHSVLGSPPEPPREGTVLLVSGDRTWLASATAFLVAETRSLSTAETAREAIDVAMRHPPNVVVIAPPISDGAPITLINQLTTLRSQAPLGIVYVSDRDREISEHARLMRAGTNDWFPRGLAPGETARRISALLAEIIGTPPRSVTRGPLRLDLGQRQALVGDVPIPLTQMEFKILEALALAAGRILSQRELTTAVGARAGSRVARSVVGSALTLREKLGAARGLLEINRRDGYRLRFVA